MTIEYLKLIREQEELADKIRHDGLLESRRIIDAANEKARDIVRTARSEADAEYRAAMARAEKEATEDYDDVISYADWECHMMMKRADEKMREAVSVIIRIMEDEWQS